MLDRFLAASHTSSAICTGLRPLLAEGRRKRKGLVTKRAKLVSRERGESEVAARGAGGVGQSPAVNPRSARFCHKHSVNKRATHRV